MKVSEVLTGAARLAGNEVELEGLFVMVEEAGYLVDSDANLDDRSNALRVDIPSMLDVLTSRVAPRGGSKYFYADPAVISGRLSTSEDGDGFAYKLSNVKKFIIQRPEETQSVFD
jgi:hypothetical protein